MEITYVYEGNTFTLIPHPHHKKRFRIIGAVAGTGAFALPERYGDGYVTSVVLHGVENAGVVESFFIPKTVNHLDIVCDLFPNLEKLEIDPENMWFQTDTQHHLCCIFTKPKSDGTTLLYCLDNRWINEEGKLNISGVWKVAATAFQNTHFSSISFFLGFFKIHPEAFKGSRFLSESLERDSVVVLGETLYKVRDGAKAVVLPDVIKFIHPMAGVTASCPEKIYLKYIRADNHLEILFTFSEEYQRRTGKCLELYIGSEIRPASRNSWLFYSTIQEYVFQFAHESHNNVSLIIDRDHPDLREVDGVVFSRDMETLYWYRPENEREIYSIPEGVRFIHEEAFAYMGESGLHHVVLPASLQDRKSLSSLKYVPEVSLAQGTTFFSMKDGFILEDGGSTLVCAPRQCYGRTIRVPEGVRRIVHGSLAWLLDTAHKEKNSKPRKNCEPMTIILPSTIEDREAFWECGWADRVEIEGNGCFSIRDEGVYSSDGKRLIWWPPQAGDSLEVAEGVEVVERGLCYFGADRNKKPLEIHLPSTIRDLESIKNCKDVRTVFLSPDHPRYQIWNGAVLSKDGERFLWLHIKGYPGYDSRRYSTDIDLHIWPGVKVVCTGSIPGDVSRVILTPSVEWIEKSIILGEQHFQFTLTEMTRDCVIEVGEEELEKAKKEKDSREWNLDLHDGVHIKGARKAFPAFVWKTKEQRFDVTVHSRRKGGNVWYTKDIPLEWVLYPGFLEYVFEMTSFIPPAFLHGPSFSRNDVPAQVISEQDVPFLIAWFLLSRGGGEVSKAGGSAWEGDDVRAEGGLEDGACEEAGNPVREALEYLRGNALEYLRKNLKRWAGNYPFFKDFLRQDILSMEETAALLEEVNRGGMTDLAALILAYGRKGKGWSSFPL